jgi:hypothetical protein
MLREEPNEAVKTKPRYYAHNLGKGSARIQTCAYAPVAQKDDRKKEVKIYFRHDDKGE